MSAASRRDMLTQIVIAGTAGALAAPVSLVAAAEVDPHVAWGTEWRAVLDYCNGPGPWAIDLEDTPEGQRMFELEGLIARTPAATLPGVAVQLALMMEFQDLDPSNDADCKDLAVLRNIRDTVQRLVGTGVVA